MPVNKQVGNLWFKTQEEIDAYDDKMVANIVLKTNKDYEDPSFSMLASRSKKENFLEESELAKQTKQQYEEILKTQKPLFGSQKYFYELPMYMNLAGVGLSYLILREMPIRNFYARSMIMAAFAYKLSKTWTLKPLDGQLIYKAPYEQPDHANRQYEIYDNVDWALKYRTLNQDGLSALDEWKLQQPGFYSDIYKGGVSSLGYYTTKKKDIMWDGTMNQPVIPMSNKLHKNNYQY